MDIATLVGIVLSFALVLSAIMMGGSMSIFINVPSVMIVVGGTLGATMINYPLPDILKVVKVVKNAFFMKKTTANELIANFVNLAGIARREGILALESKLNEMEDEFMRTGMQLSVDGLEPAAIKEILETEIEAIRERHKLGAEIFTTMGTFAPALGMIGTLIGLVQMLQTMSDPSTIGPAMAVALLTTFYGAIMANILFLPIAGKLRNRSGEEVMIKDLMTEGVISIAKGENPRVIEQKLNAYLPPQMRQSSFGK
ncbi:MAG: flagellar motor protein [Deltaproteobacteria bacterium]|nr:flagellar motor protein [Deltaproteobacteria bacterium]MBW1928482.1 flagellar motor protein [Deltaproteobacteria bacterium]MBW2024184.1 flagellar motor protein [Deltaproteobacteria bacterium]MBW2124886.1 flagellar motor protein [Deltaproteobacteria bacterium]